MPKLLSLKEIQDRGVKLGSRQLSRYEEQGLFPKRIRLTHKLNVWREDEVNAWLSARMTEAA
jgi:predicted DNA-binding transcriptional regulator AlpA